MSGNWCVKLTPGHMAEVLLKAAEEWKVTEKVMAAVTELTVNVNTAFTCTIIQGLYDLAFFGCSSTKRTEFIMECAIFLKGIMLSLILTNGIK